MPPKTLHKDQIPVHIPKYSELTQAFYKKIAKRYSNFKQRNPLASREKMSEVRKQPIRNVIMEQMRKQLDKFPELIRSQSKMTMGMIKNQIYCKKHGERASNQSEQNFGKMQQSYIMDQYHSKIGAIKRKHKTQMFNSDEIKSKLLTRKSFNLQSAQQ